MGCLPKLWSSDHELIRTARRLLAQLLAEAKAYHRVRQDLTSTDISLAMWSIRGVLETTGGAAPEAVRRLLDPLGGGNASYWGEIASPAGQSGSG